MSGEPTLATTPEGRVADDYFRAQWASGDPWRLEDRWYEQRKRALTLACLPRRRARHAFEPGCAQGLLTEELAGRCDRVTAIEPVAEVAARAARRCRHAEHVDVSVGALPGDGPSGPVDLVVASEVLYYLDGAGLDRFVAGLHDWLEPDGALVAVHWTGPTNYPSSAADVHGRLHRVPWLTADLHVRGGEFVVDAWTRT